MNGATIFLKDSYQIIGFQGTTGRQKLGFFNFVKLFGFIDVNQTVSADKTGKQGWLISHFSSDDNLSGICDKICIGRKRNEFYVMVPVGNIMSLTVMKNFTQTTRSLEGKNTRTTFMTTIFSGF